MKELSPTFRGEADFPEALFPLLFILGWDLSYFIYKLILFLYVCSDYYLKSSSYLDT